MLQALTLKQEALTGTDSGSANGCQEGESRPGRCWIVVDRLRQGMRS